MWLHAVPVLLGAGTRLFGGERAAIGEPVAGAVTHLRYRVGRP